MDNEKSVGLGGFPCGFYKELWDMIDPNIFNVYKEVMVSSSLGAIINKGNIKFILKVGYPKFITN